MNNLHVPGTADGLPPERLEFNEGCEENETPSLYFSEPDGSCIDVAEATPESSPEIMAEIVRRYNAAPELVGFALFVARGYAGNLEDMAREALEKAGVAS